MFDIGWSELLVIGVVALVVIGPKELPAVLRTVGQWVGKVRRMASEFQGQFQDAMREAEMADLKKTFDDVTTAKDYGLNLDPITDIKNQLEKSVGDLPASVTTTTPAPEAVATGTGPVTPGQVAASEPAPVPAEPPPNPEPRPGIPRTVAELEAARAPAEPVTEKQPS